MAFELVDTRLLERVAKALERIADRLDGVVEMRDVDRARVRITSYRDVLNTPRRGVARG